jgi:hypothetical protein
MDVSCPSLPLKMLVAVDLTADEHTTRFIAARRCHCIEFCLCRLLINIKVSLSLRADASPRELFCIKYQ